MLQFNIKNKSSIRLDIVKDGMMIETKLARMIENNEPIKDKFGGTLIYMDRADGVSADCNPRTDKHLIAIEVAGTIGKSRVAKRTNDLNAGKTTDNSGTNADNAA